MIPVVNINDVCTLITPTSSRPFHTHEPDGSIYTKNATYAYFIDQARQAGMQVFVTHYLNVKDGVSSLAMTLDESCDLASAPDGVWRVHENVPIQCVYDKFIDRNGQTKAVKDYLELNHVPMLNPRLVETIINDKLAQAAVFGRGHEAHVPPTMVLNPAVHGYDGLDRICRRLYEEASAHPYKGAFMPNKMFVKPRSGTAGGKGIFTMRGVKSHIIDSLKKDIEYVVCPSVDFGRVPGTDIEGVHEIRIILVNGEPSIGFIKIPKVGDICSASRSNLRYFNLEDRSADVEFARSIDSRLGSILPRVCSVDFCYAKDGRRVVIEVNDTPGMQWAHGNHDDERFSKKFMRDIVSALVRCQMGMHPI